MDNSIKIAGASYPCRMSMGAGLRFKRLTGKEVTEIGGDAFSEVATLIFVCVQSSCKADGVEFGMSLEDFCDCVGIEEMTAVQQSLIASMTAASPGGGDKIPSVD